LSSVQQTTKPPRRRTRLDVDARRQQLLEIGKEVFASRAYEEVQIDDVAARAGASSGLLYHYFPSKRDFYVAAQAAMAEELRDATTPDSSLPPAERLRASIDAYLDFVEDRSAGYISLHRRGVGDDRVRAVVEESQAQQADRILAAIVEPGEPPAEILRVAVRGWLNFMVTGILDWLENRSVERDRLRDLFIYVLIDATTAAGRVDPAIKFAIPPPDVPDP
jgi:AcrR family transcriptional regulator